LKAVRIRLRARDIHQKTTAYRVAVAAEIFANPFGFGEFADKARVLLFDKGDRRADLGVRPYPSCLS